MNFSSQNRTGNGAGQPLRPLSIRAGLSVQELKAMTAMRIAHTQQQQQGSQLANQPGNSLSYQTANPQQLRAAGIQPAVVNDRLNPNKFTGVIDNRSAAIAAGNVKYPAQIHSNAGVSTHSGQSLPAIQRTITDFRNQIEANNRIVNLHNYEVGSTTNTRRQQYFNADFAYMNQFTGPQSVTQMRVAPFQQAQDPSLNYAGYQYRRGHFHHETEIFVSSPSLEQRQMLGGFSHNSYNGMDFGGLAPGINVQLSSFSSEYNRDTTHRVISSPSISRGVSNDTNFTSGDRILARDGVVDLKSPLSGGSLGLEEMAVSKELLETFPSTSHHNRSLQFSTKLEPTNSFYSRQHEFDSSLTNVCVIEAAIAERFDKDHLAAQRSHHRNPFHKSKSDSTLPHDFVSPVNLPFITRMDQGEPLPTQTSSAQPFLSPLPEHMTANESIEVNSDFSRLERSGSRFPLLKSKTAPKILTIGTSSNTTELPSPGTSPGMRFLARKVLSLHSPFRERFPSDQKDSLLASEMAESVLTGTPPTGTTPLSQHGGGFFKSIEEEREELLHTAREEEDDEDEVAYVLDNGARGNHLHDQNTTPLVGAMDRAPLEE